MPRCLSVSASVFAFLLIQINGSPASAQQASGRTVGVIPDASALRSEGRSPLAVQQPVYMGDSIQTGPSGEAQIDFVDNTRLVVGPASSLLIDNSVLRNRRTMSSFVVSALRGTFRFISGSSPKPAYAIRTPTATIGVRGTEFDFAVLPDGSTEFVLFHGSAQVCDRSGACTVVRGACDAIVVPRSGPIRSLVDREDRNARLRANFPYVRARNASLRPEFRTDVRTCGDIAASPVDPDSKDRAAPAAASTAAAAAGPAPAAPSSPRSSRRHPPDLIRRHPRPHPRRLTAAPPQPTPNTIAPDPPTRTEDKSDRGGKGDHGGKGEHGGKGDHGGKGEHGGKGGSRRQGRAWRQGLGRRWRPPWRRAFRRPGLPGRRAAVGFRVDRWSGRGQRE